MAERNSRRSTSGSRSHKQRTTVIRSEINTGKNISRRQRSRKRKQMYLDKRQKTMFIGIAVIILLLACAIGFATRRNGSEVLVNGESVGVIDTRSVTKDDFSNSLNAMIAEKVGTNVQILDDIEIKGVHISKKSEVLTTEAMLSKLRDTVVYNIEAYAIAVDGNVVATLKNEDEAKTVLQYLNELYTPKDIEEGADISTSYVQDVQIVSQFTNSDDVMTVEDAENKISTGESSVVTYTVASGDTLSSIASRFGMSLNELIEMNQNISVTSSIYIGEKLTVNNVNPYITVKTTVTTNEQVTAGKEVEYQYDNTKSSSYKKIIQQGTAGVTEVTKEKVYINGVFDSENTVSTRVVTQPVKEIVCIGTN